MRRRNPLRLLTPFGWTVLAWASGMAITTATLIASLP